MYVPTYDDVLIAHERIKPYVHRTPVLTSTTFDDMTGARLFFKCENLQKAGAFKVRGATNAVFSLTGDEAERGVVTHSSGNHALSLTCAAGFRGIKSTVVMPETAPQAKLDAVRGYGGEVITCAPSLKAREQTLADLVARTDGNFVHPYNDHRVIAGQGTCSLELIDQVGALDAVIAPIGGGGMVSGTSITCAALSGSTAVYAGEPKNADDACRSFRAGRIIEDDAPDTVADGLRVSLRALTFRVISDHVTDILTVTEDEIVAAMRLIWQRMKIVVEPSSAVALAAVFANPEVFRGKRVGVILTGGNVDLNKLPWLNAG